MITRRNLFGTGLVLPWLSLPTMVKAAPAPAVDFEALWLREALIQFVKHYECSRDPRYIYYICRYHVDELPKVRYAALRTFLLEPETNIFADKGTATVPVVMLDGSIYYPTRCSHFDFIVGCYELLEQAGSITVHRKLPGNYPYENLEHIRIADHLLPVVRDLLRAA